MSTLGNPVGERLTEKFPIWIVILFTVLLAVKTFSATPAPKSVKILLISNRLQDVCGPRRIPRFTKNGSPNVGRYILGFRLEYGERSIVLPDSGMSGEFRVLFSSSEDAFEKAHGLNVYELQVAGKKIIGIEKKEPPLLHVYEDEEDFVGASTTIMVDKGTTVSIEFIRDLVLVNVLKKGKERGFVLTKKDNDLFLVKYKGHRPPTFEPAPLAVLDVVHKACMAYE
ncbi:hypothetical protein JXA85_01155 [Candidatus Woesearchaeota archaeon]|nr:hypothetical protein [Candidatus Woesearchaeota archaeon]